MRLILRQSWRSSDGSVGGGYEQVPETPEELAQAQQAFAALAAAR